MTGFEPSLVLIVRAPNGDVREVELRDTVVLGRDESADVRVDDKKVSRRHAAFKLIDGKPYVEDLGSSNGVRLDGARIERRARIDSSSEIRVGGYVITLHMLDERTRALELDLHGRLAEASHSTEPSRSAPKAGESRPQGSGAHLERVVFIGLAEPIAGRRFSLGPGESVLGRLDECDVSILHGSVSRQHARLVFEEGPPVLHDLGSANGVFVGDRRVRAAELAHGDRIRVGQVELRVELPRAPAVPVRPLSERIDAYGPEPSDLRWLLTGLLALMVAAAVLVAALSWQRDTPPTELAGRWARSLGLFAGPEERAEAPPETTDSSPAQDVAAPPDADAIEPMDGPFGEISTATAPWSPRGPDGLPTNIPAVNPAFEHAEAVSEAMDGAKEALARQDRDAATRLARKTLELDPIHGGAKAILARVAELEAADEALKRAEKLVQRQELAEAYRILSAVPVELPQAEAARARAQKLRERAIADALKRGKAASMRKASYLKAHEAFTMVLSLEPDHGEALQGIRDLERKLRRGRVSFVRWRPPGPGKDAEDRGGHKALLARYGRRLTSVLDLYLRGDPEAAIRKAEALRRRSRGVKPSQLDEVIDGMLQVRRDFERVRTEVANDPSQAWAMLIELEGVERGFLPPETHSYLVMELRADLSDAFARQGEAMFDTERYEAAFQRWEAGYKLDPTNPRVRKGLERLEEVAQDLAERGRVAARRGAKTEACGRFRAATRLTRAEHEVHTEARQQALRMCP